MESGRAGSVPAALAKYLCHLRKHRAVQHVLGGNLAVFAQAGREVLAPREQPRIAIGGRHIWQEIDREHVPLAGKSATRLNTHTPDTP